MDEDYTGCWTALVTPFTKKYEVDWEKLGQLLEFQQEQKVDGVLPMGSTGESATVTHKEHSKIISKTAEIIDGRCKVLAGTGSNSTDEAILETDKAVEAGVDACLLVDCYYNKPSSMDLRIQYYQPILTQYPDMDFIAYAIPGRSVTVITPEDLALIHAEHENLVAVKEATGDFKRMQQTRNLLPDDFNIISGDDPNTLKMMTDTKIGASGVISVISNLVPHTVLKLTQLLLSGKTSEAQKIDDALKPLSDIVGVTTTEDVKLPNGKTVQVTYKHPNPLPIKTAMQGLGMLETGCKRPLGRLTAKGVEIVRDTVQAVWKTNPELLEPVSLHFDVDIDERIENDKNWDQLAY